MGFPLWNERIGGADDAAMVDCAQEGLNPKKG